MIRISTIFIAICMVLIAASLGFVVHSVAGLNISESAIVALTALTFLILSNAVAMRLRDRSTVNGQITDLSQGTADLAHHVADFGRRLIAIEQRVTSLESTSREQAQSTAGELSALGVLVKQLAMSIASHDDSITAIDNLLDVRQPPAAPVRATNTPPLADAAQQAADLEWMQSQADFAATLLQSGAAESPKPTALAQSDLHNFASVKKAIEGNRIDIYLQPLVTLPQRKVRFYEAVSRIRDDNDQLIEANDFITAAEAGGLMGEIDRMVLVRCIQVLQRLMVRNKGVGVFCNLSFATLGNPEVFAQCLDLLEANRALAPSLILEFKQATLRNLGPIESENLAALAQRGYRFSIDHVSDLRIEPRELADRGVRFIKVPAHMLLDQKQMSESDIHPADLSNLLGRFGIDLVVERVEGERAILDLLDYGVRFGQGFLFAPPRPLRPEGTAKSHGTNQSTNGANVETGKIDPAQLKGKAALARRAALPN